MIVVDASLVVAALLPEKDSEAARALIASEACVAPDLLISECVNALWKSVRLERIMPDEAQLALEALTSLGVVLVSSSDLADRALQLAITLGHPAYDCFYLALAETRGVEMVTQDATLMRKVESIPASTATLRLLKQRTRDD